MDKRNRTLLFAALATIAVVGIGLLVVMWQPPGTVRVTIKAIPDDSAITLDGKSIQAGRQDLSKGNHTFKVSRQYFDDTTKTVNTDNLQNGQTLYLLPDATSKEALQWLKDHPDVQAQREAAGGAVTNQTQTNDTKNYPYINQLPYEAIDFKVDYGYKNDGQINLVVTLQPYSDPQQDPADYQQQLKDYKTEALNYLKSINVDINTTPITWLPQDPSK